jgi:hypothetical protein
LFRGARNEVASAVSATNSQTMLVQRFQNINMLGLISPF